MGDGAYDADVAEELRGLGRELREMLGHTDTGNVVWTARDGRKSKLKDMSVKRLRAIEGYLNKTINHNDNKDWLIIIQNEIKNRS